jgi:hypothetical protein
LIIGRRDEGCVQCIFVDCKPKLTEDINKIQTDLLWEREYAGLNFFVGQIVQQTDSNRKKVTHY